MVMHLSLRLPWHDRGWDGHVCDNPTANVYCAGEYGLKAHGIRDRKKDELEERIKGKPYPVKDSVYQPPCGLTIQTFGGSKTFTFAHEPKSFGVTPIDWTVRGPKLEYRSEFLGLILFHS